MKKAALLFIVSTFFAATSASAHAFDGKRSGFQIGLGLGAHSSELTYDNNFGSSDIEPEQNLAVSLMLGYGFSNRVVVHLGGKGGKVLVNDEAASLAIAGVGGSFYLTELSPSLYLTGLVGSASISLDEEEADQGDSGDGWLVGIGFEVAERLHLELSHAQADLTDPDNTAITSTLESSFLTLQYIWY